MSKRRTTRIAAVLLSGAVAATSFSAAQADTIEITPIEQVQGTGDSSALAGQQATVRGVVTGAYAEGGIRGFYLQSAGTGAQLPTGGSPAVFVYAPDEVSSVQVGDHLQVSGTVSEYYGLTQIKAESVQGLEEAAEAIKPLAISLPSDEAGREQIESMLVEPQGEFTVSDNYSLNQYGELSLAMGTSSILPGEKLLRQPTDVFAPGSGQAAALAEENAQRSIVVDDGATLNFSTAKNTTVALPYIDAEQRVSVGANAAFTGPMILDYRYDLWRLQPQGQVIGADDADIALAFEQIDNEAPQEVGGNVSVGSFNVLNYFTTTGDQLEGCKYYTDREGNPLTVRQGCDARGAANAESFARQQSKIVAALGKFTADVVVLEEIENSARSGQDRDAALAHLVEQLNSAAGQKIWSYVPSPAAIPADEDVIRTAIIYRAKTVKPIDESVILDDEAFGNARDPLGQAFQKVGGNQNTRFVVVANHFKSKGSNPDDGSGNADSGDGQGAWNADRVEQAKALVGFADQLKQSRNTRKVLLAGDFNSYAAEDPIRVLADAGYVDLGASADSQSYIYDGLSGSLDHILASPELAAKVTGQDIWNINAIESVGYEYSRYNYNITDLFTANQYRSSDHDPVLVGLELNKKG
ncbi:MULTISPECIES: ExeM/NucH family extracellular endonuclease [Glutamicibacter]|uniref:ExeM/NucH family extracellular endonuclease n=1 Tax=Glutamicibacter TaxID=1742989 RepID=UPI0015C5330E|nr:MULTISPECIES: ExeM/NucH family extracellular endonuclease [Glutamicibacter]MBF6671855.1 ExeM/NucH family extracellular endonuclease [Glutamicibacter sp. FBE19]NQD39618.1 ExeM/NucH family extracellular endonuclease [Glutamicibacter halophytocola]